MIWQNETRFQVAVFWPIKGSETQGDYGGIQEFPTLDAAEASRSFSIKLGYKPENIHIRKVTVKRIEPAATTTQEGSK